MTGIGMIYNFSHGHADMGDFPPIWKRMQPYVVAVNVTGMVPSARLIAVSGRSAGGNDIIDQSGYQRGPVGVIAEQGGDAEVTLGNDLRGVAPEGAGAARVGWSAAEIRFRVDDLRFGSTDKLKHYRLSNLHK